jgi:hypothetical protein
VKVKRSQPQRGERRVLPAHAVSPRSSERCDGEVFPQLLLPPEVSYLSESTKHLSKPAVRASRQRHTIRTIKTPPHLAITPECNCVMFRI